MSKTTLNLSCMEPAPRSIRVMLSNAELAAVLLYHERHRRRIARFAGELATGEHGHLPPQQTAELLEECQDQRAHHQARAFELSAVLRRTMEHGTPNN